VDKGIKAIHSSLKEVVVAGEKLFHLSHEKKSGRGHSYDISNDENRKPIISQNLSEGKPELE